MTGDYALTFKPPKDIMEGNIIYLSKTVSIFRYIYKPVQLQKSFSFLIV